MFVRESSGDGVNVNNGHGENSFFAQFDASSSSGRVSQEFFDFRAEVSGDGEGLGIFR